VTLELPPVMTAYARWPAYTGPPESPPVANDPGVTAMSPHVDSPLSKMQPETAEEVVPQVLFVDWPHLHTLIPTGNAAVDVMSV